MPSRGTELFPAVMGVPVIITMHNVGKPELAQKALDAVGGDAARFLSRCRREFAASTLQVIRRHVVTDRYRLDYKAVQGIEYLDVFAGQQLLDELEEKLYDVALWFTPPESPAAGSRGDYYVYPWIETVCGADDLSPDFDPDVFGVEIEIAEGGVATYGLAFDMDYLKELGGGKTQRVIVGLWAGSYLDYRPVKNVWVSLGIRYDSSVQNGVVTRTFAENAAYVAGQTTCGYPSDIIPATLTPAYAPAPWSGTVTTYPSEVPEGVTLGQSFPIMYLYEPMDSVVTCKYPSAGLPAWADHLTAAALAGAVDDIIEDSHSWLSASYGPYDTTAYLTPLDVAPYCTWTSPVDVGTYTFTQTDQYYGYIISVKVLASFTSHYLKYAYKPDVPMQVGPLNVNYSGPDSEPLITSWDDLPLAGGPVSISVATDSTLEVTTTDCGDLDETEYYMWLHLEVSDDGTITVLATALDETYAGPPDWCA